MAVPIVDTIALSDVCLEIYGSLDTLNRSLIQCHNDANLDGFDLQYDTFGQTESLLDFRGYVHDVTPPSTPTLSCDSSTTTSITVDWTAATDANGIQYYQLDYKANKSSTWITISSTLSSSTLTYTQGGLTSTGGGSPYDFRVRAKDNYGNWGNWSATQTCYTAPAQSSYSISLGFSFLDGADACDEYTLNPSIFYIDTANFVDATGIWDDSGLSIESQSGFFSDGTDYRDWDETLGTLSAATTCSGGGSSTT